MVAPGLISEFTAFCFSQEEIEKSFLLPWIVGGNRYIVSHLCFCCLSFRTTASLSSFFLHVGLERITPSSPCLVILLLSPHPLLTSTHIIFLRNNSNQRSLNYVPLLYAWVSPEPTFWDHKRQPTCIFKIEADGNNSNWNIPQSILYLYSPLLLEILFHLDPHDALHV